MKKIQILAALCAVCAFSMAAVATASANEWLLNGAAITAKTAVETTGELTLDVLVLGVLAVAIDCNGAFDGTVGPGAADEITAVLNLEKVEVGKELVGTALSCEVLTSAFEECGKVGELASVWVDGLPWKTELLLNGSVIEDDITSATAGYHVVCPGSAKKENLCNGVLSAVVTNETTDVLGTFSEATNEETCTTGTGHVSGSGLTVDLAGGTLAAS